MLCTVLAAICCATLLSLTTASTLTTVSGRVLPIDQVQQRVPYLSRHLLENAIYEQTPEGNLANRHHVLRVRQVAPHFERVILERQVITESDGQENLLTELITRTGPDATFVYATDARSIIAAWGSDFVLHPLNRREFPGVFVNNRAAEVVPSFARDYLFVSNHDDNIGDPVDQVPHHTLERHSKLTSVGSRMITRMEGLPEREERELELFVLHEKTFCRSFKDANEAHAVLGTHVAKLKPKFKGTGLVPGASRIVGPCAIDTKLTLPNEVAQCPMDSPDCSRTAILLNYYRNYDSYQLRRRDLTVVFSNYTKQEELFQGIIGSAYVGATCNRKYGWAWVHHTNVNDIVFAHEVGHSLGALHEEQGIMKPSVGNQTENVEFSSKSIGLMNQFIDRASTVWCLKKLKWENDGLKIEVPRSIFTSKMLAHDLSFARFYGQSQTNLLVGITTKISDGFGVKIAILQNIVSESGGFKSGSWKGPYDIPGVTSYKHGAVGVSFGHIRSETSNDIVISYLKPGGVMEYIVGFGFSISDAAGFNVEEWSDAIEIPFSGSSQPVTSIGIDVGDIKRDGKLDLAVGFVVGKNDTRFKIGAVMGADGQIKGGWSSDRYVKPPLSSSVKSISPAILNPPGESVTHVAFYTNEQLGSRLQRYYRVAKKVTTSGAAIGDWTTAIPAQVAPIPAKTGGLAVDMLSGSDEFTTVVMQSDVYGVPDSKSFAYLDFGFNITAGILADQDGSIFESILYGREAGCSECYKGAEKETCLERMKLCEECKYEYFGGSAVSGTSVKIDEANYNDTLFCAGFHKIFISPEGDTCGRNSAREYVSAEGMEVLFREGLEGIMDENGTFTEKDKTFETTVNLGYDEKPIEGTAENGRTVKIFRPNKMRLKLKRGTRLWDGMIREALRRLNTKEGVSLTFKDVSSSKVVKKGGSTFFVYLKFDSDFRDEWIKNEIWRPYGTSGSTW